MSGVSAAEFEKLNQDLIALKAQVYESREREQNALHKQQLAEQEAATLRKDAAGKMKAGLKGIFGNKAQTEVEDLKPQLEELRTQNEALKANVKHMFAENQQLQEQITHFKEQLGVERSSFEKSAEDERNALAAAHLADLEDQIEAFRKSEAEKDAELLSLKSEVANIKQQLAQCEKDLQIAQEAKISSSSMDTPAPSRRASTPGEETPVDANSEDLSTRLMQSVQKKDEALRLLREDMDRLVVKLREKEIDIMKERENASQVPALQKVLKEQEAKLKKLASEAAKSTKVSVIQDQMKKVTEGLTEANDKLETEKKDLQTQLVVAEEALNQHKALLTTSQEVCEEQKKKVVVLNMELEKLQVAHQQLTAEHQEAEEKFAKESRERQDQFQQTKADWTAQQTTLKEELSTCQSERDFLKASLASTQNLLFESENAVKQAREQEAQLTKARDELQVSLKALESAFEESKVNHSIESKKRNRLVEELRSQLKKDALRVRELEANVAETKDALTERRKSLSRRDSAGDGVSSELLQAYENSRKSSGGSEVEQEVTAALSVRLEQSQTENYALKQKVKFLEQNMQLLNEDVVAKKAVIQFLSRRIEPGVMGTPNTNPEARKLFQNQPPAIQQELFDKMEVALQEATLLNLEIKDNLRKMGTEGTRLLSVIDDLDKEKKQLEDELLAVREMYQELKDEKELNEMARQDAEKLLKNTELQFKSESSMLSSRLAEVNLNLKLVQMERDRLLAHQSNSGEQPTHTVEEGEITQPAKEPQNSALSETTNRISAPVDQASLETGSALALSSPISEAAPADAPASSSESFPPFPAPSESQVTASTEFVSNEDARPRNSTVARLTDILNADLTLPSTSAPAEGIVEETEQEVAEGETEVSHLDSSSDFSHNDIEIISQDSPHESSRLDFDTQPQSHRRNSEPIEPERTEELEIETAKTPTEAEALSEQPHQEPIECLQPLEHESSLPSTNLDIDSPVVPNSDLPADLPSPLAEISLNSPKPIDAFEKESVVNAEVVPLEDVAEDAPDHELMRLIQETVAQQSELSGQSSDMSTDTSGLIQQALPTDIPETVEQVGKLQEGALPSNSGTVVEGDELVQHEEAPLRPETVEEVDGLIQHEEAAAIHIPTDD